MKLRGYLGTGYNSTNNQEEFCFDIPDGCQAAYDPAQSTLMIKRSSGGAVLMAVKGVSQFHVDEIKVESRSVSKRTELEKQIESLQKEMVRISSELEFYKEVKGEPLPDQ